MSADSELNPLFEKTAAKTDRPEKAPEKALFLKSVRKKRKKKGPQAAALREGADVVFER